MAIDRLARATSLSWTGGSATSPLNDIQEWSYSESQEIAEHLIGTARVTGHYKGTNSATITVTTDDMAIWETFVVGDAVTNLTLEIENAIECDGSAIGGSADIVLSDAKLVEKSEISHDNTNSAPVTGSLTFVLSRPAADAADPTATVTASA